MHISIYIPRVPEGIHRLSSAFPKFCTGCDENLQQGSHVWGLGGSGSRLNFVGAGLQNFAAQQ